LGQTDSNSSIASDLFNPRRRGRFSNSTQFPICFYTVQSRTCTVRNSMVLFLQINHCTSYFRSKQTLVFRIHSLFPGLHYITLHIFPCDRSSIASPLNAQGLVSFVFYRSIDCSACGVVRSIPFVGIVFAMCACASFFTFPSSSVASFDDALVVAALEQRLWARH